MQVAVNSQTNAIYAIGANNRISVINGKINRP